MEEDTRTTLMKTNAALLKAADVVGASQNDAEKAQAAEEARQVQSAGRCSSFDPSSCPVLLFCHRGIFVFKTSLPDTLEYV